MQVKKNKKKTRLILRMHDAPELEGGTQRVYISWILKLLFRSWSFLYPSHRQIVTRRMQSIEV